MKNKNKFMAFLSNSDSLYNKSLVMFKWSMFVLLIIITIISLWMYVESDSQFSIIRT